MFSNIKNTNLRTPILFACNITLKIILIGGFKVQIINLLICSMMNTKYLSLTGPNIQYEDFQISISNEESILLIKQNFFDKTQIKQGLPFINILTVSAPVIAQMKQRLVLLRQLQLFHQVCYFSFFYLYYSKCLIFRKVVCEQGARFIEFD